jgi:hypothetical protein
MENRRGVRKIVLGERKRDYNYKENRRGVGKIMMGMRK